MALGLADRLGYVNLGTKLRPSVKRGYGTWVGVNLDTIRAHGPRRVLDPFTLPNSGDMLKTGRGSGWDRDGRGVEEPGRVRSRETARRHGGTAARRQRINAAAIDKLDVMGTCSDGGLWIFLQKTGSDQSLGHGGSPDDQSTKATDPGRTSSLAVLGLVIVYWPSL